MAKESHRIGAKGNPHAGIRFGSLAGGAHQRPEGHLDGTIGLTARVATVIVAVKALQ